MIKMIGSECTECVVERNGQKKCTKIDGMLT